jgi:hypothetical protein
VLNTTADLLDVGGAAFQPTTRTPNDSPLGNLADAVISREDWFVGFDDKLGHFIAPRNPLNLTDSRKRARLRGVATIIDVQLRGLCAERF